jgi:hypothetical protein
MNKYVAFLAIVTASHLVRCVADYAYFTYCTGIWTSIFTWNSPTCRGLRWTADSIMTNVVSIVGVQVAKLLTFDFFSNVK